MQTIITQHPIPGSSMVMFCGDTITFTLTISESLQGEAWIRTDLGFVSISRREIIDRVDHDEIRLNEAWHDIKMVKSNGQFSIDSSNFSQKNSTNHNSDTNPNNPNPNTLIFSITLPLIEPGHFKAKCFFLETGKSTPQWPSGENCTINVDSAGACSSNIIYNAFVRQFGKIKKELPKIQEEQAIALLDSQGYAVIPPSGKFRDLIKEVDFIFTELGCRVLHLLPVHPTPTTYGRMGRYGSPYAALNFTEVDPALAEFDPSATPLEQFMELADAVHFHWGYLILDIAINHTGWASSIHESHPEWLARQADGTIEVPGAWGVKWEDLTRLDYSKKELWQYMADIFLLWCKRRVDGFRCDAGYMIPVQAWEYIVARVRQEYPDTIFFLEGLGGGIDATCNLLNLANLNWAYSELFQNYDRNQIESYLPQSIEISQKYGLMVNFAETHDNLRLASVSHTYAKMRTAICALFSVSGSFGFASGVEWFAKEKINVHESPSLNWGAKENQIEHIKRLNHILKTHPTFTQHTELKFIHISPSNTISIEQTMRLNGELLDTEATNNHNYLALLRYHKPTKSRLLVVVNLDCQNPTTVFWSLNSWGIEVTLSHHLLTEQQLSFYNLLTDEQVKIKIDKDNCSLQLKAGEVVALAPKKLFSVDNKQPKCRYSQPCIFANLDIPANVIYQKFKAKALSILATFNGYGDISQFDITEATNSLYKNPIEFCRSCNPDTKESRVVVWRWGRDNRRTVMVPPNFFLMVTAPAHFRADIKVDNRDRGTAKVGEGKEFTVGYEESLPMENGEFFAIFLPIAQSIIGESITVESINDATDNNPIYSSQSINYFAVNNPLHSEYTLGIRIFKEKKAQESKASLLYLAATNSTYNFDIEANNENLLFCSSFTRKEIIKDPSLKLLGFNKKGAMMRAAAWWGRLDSKYDALLAANINPYFPENRWIFLTRYRIWAIYQGYSRELTLDCLEQFTFLYNDDQSYSNIGKWLFNVPTSEGNYFKIEITLKMVEYTNQVVMQINRKNFQSRNTEQANSNFKISSPHFDKSDTLIKQSDTLAKQPDSFAKQPDSFVKQPDNLVKQSDRYFNKKMKGQILFDEKSVEIIVRPDIESRSFHDTVKAWTGPEHQWKNAIKTSDNGFVFKPEQNSEQSNEKNKINHDSSIKNASIENIEVYQQNRTTLAVQISSGIFVFEPEWQYMVYHPLEAERGLDPYSDLFSPGYFKVNIKGGEAISVNATVPSFEQKDISNLASIIDGFKFINRNGKVDCKDSSSNNFFNKFNDKITTFTNILCFKDAIRSSLDAFIVERERYKSVIAGYPWFLDWGRDSLIFCRALIEDRRFSDAKDILRLFGRFEHDGTLPNMICGEDAGNRETSDAPLWFFAACRDLAEKEGYDFLDEPLDYPSSQDASCVQDEFNSGLNSGGYTDSNNNLPLNSRTFREVLISMAHSFIKGTYTGMGIDHATNLFYSPSHFTWMDTNFPACSPRQGYPIETQALWYYALIFLDKIDLTKTIDNTVNTYNELNTSKTNNEKDTQTIWKKMALDVQNNVIKLFYREKDGFFADCLHCDTRKSALNCLPDDALRPNQLFLITLGLLSFEEIDDQTDSQELQSGEILNYKNSVNSVNKKISKNYKNSANSVNKKISNETMSINTIESCMELLVPGAIRSLADRDIAVPLHIYHKYCGSYQGDEDNNRKPAYHNGTAWTWQFPVFCEAWAKVFGGKDKKQGIFSAMSWLGSSIGLLRKGCSGYIPEILEGDYPHTPRGCDAQAWGSSELVRVWLKLENLN